MFNKEMIKSIINELGLENEYYKLWSGGSLCVRGIRETHDVDLGVESKTFDRLLKEYNGNVYEVNLGGDKFDIKHEWGNIEIFRDDNFYNEIELVDGIWCQKIESIIELKRKLNREKDIQDLKMIYSMIKDD